MNNSNSTSLTVADLLKFVESLPLHSGPGNLFMHPEVLASVAKGAEAKASMGIFGKTIPLHGVPIYSSSLMPKHPKKWQFPRDPFVDYDESDEAWARPINYGREVDDTEKMVCYSIRMPRF